MSSRLYAACWLCAGTGTPRPDARVVIEPADRERVAAQIAAGICPGCQGRKLLPIGLTEGQVDRVLAQRDALRALVERAKEDGLDDAWRKEARVVLRATGGAGHGPGGGR